MLGRIILKTFRSGLPKNISRSFYDSRTRHDTIYAPSTSIEPGKGSPLAIVRISGKLTDTVIDKLTHRKLLRIYDNPISKQKCILPREATLTKIYTKDSQELIDIGLVLWFPKPNSYTGEDVCELHLHGSRAIMTKILDNLGQFRGLRPAEPGEFSRRAVTNGKLSLMQAESLLDLISSQTDQQRKMALNGLSGTTRTRYDSWSEKLIKLLAHLEASIDFGEDELIGEKEVIGQCILKLNILAKEISSYIRISSQCRDIVKTGTKVAIIGRPNAGKSTFMNLLCQREKSIVSDLSGTTRDVVEHSIELGGHSMNLCDTAGLKQLSFQEEVHDKDTILGQHDSIERDGIRRALNEAKAADVILYLVDGTQLTDSVSDASRLLAEIESLVETIEDQAKCFHLIINKIDLNEKLCDTNYVDQIQDYSTTKSKILSSIKISSISCKTRKNIDKLVRDIVSDLDVIVSDRTLNQPPALDYVNERHLSLLRSTHRHLELASRLDFSRIDEVAQHVREAVDYLSKIVGNITNEQVFDIVFRDFCIGK